MKKKRTKKPKIKEIYLAKPVLQVVPNSGQMNTNPQTQGNNRQFQPFTSIIPMESEMELISIQHELIKKNNRLKLLQRKYDQLSKKFQEMVYNHKIITSQLQELKKSKNEKDDKIAQLLTENEDLNFEKMKLEDAKMKNVALLNEIKSIELVKSNLEKMVSEEKEVAEKRMDAKYDREIKALQAKRMELEKITREQFKEDQRNKSTIDMLNKKILQLNKKRSKIENENIDLKNENENFRKKMKKRERKWEEIDNLRKEFAEKMLKKNKKLEQVIKENENLTIQFTSSEEKREEYEEELSLLKKEFRETNETNEDIIEKLKKEKMEIIRRKTKDFGAFMAKKKEKTLHQPSVPEVHVTQKNTKKKFKKTVTFVDQVDDNKGNEDTFEIERPNKNDGSGMKMSHQENILDFSGDKILISIEFEKIFIDEKNFPFQHKLPLFLSFGFYNFEDVHSNIIHKMEGDVKCKRRFNVELSDLFVFYLLNNKLVIYLNVADGGDYRKIGFCEISLRELMKRSVLKNIGVVNNELRTSQLGTVSYKIEADIPVEEMINDISSLKNLL